MEDIFIRWGLIFLACLLYAGLQHFSPKNKPIKAVFYLVSALYVLAQMLIWIFFLLTMREMWREAQWKEFVGMVLIFVPYTYGCLLFYKKAVEKKLPKEEESSL